MNKLIAGLIATAFAATAFAQATPYTLSLHDALPIDRKSVV